MTPAGLPVRGSQIGNDGGEEWLFDRATNHDHPAWADTFRAWLEYLHA